MPTRNPRHLAERHLPLRLMLVAFGLTFAVLAAMVASAALVPSVPPTPTVAAPLPTATTIDPSPWVAPSGAGSGPEEPPGSAPIALAAPEPATAAPGRPARPLRHPRPPRPARP